MNPAQRSQLERKLWTTAISAILMCVAGIPIAWSAAPPQQYRVLVNVVIDNYTGLEWQRMHSGPVSWQAAVNHCEDSGVNGSTDWRLPNVKELITLLDETQINPAIDGMVFPNTHGGAFWSSTFNVDDPENAMYVDFYDGSVHAYSSMTNSYRVRCVRGGR